MRRDVAEQQRRAASNLVRGQHILARRARTVLLFFAAAANTAQAHGQHGAADSPVVSISLLTIGPGREPQTWFGHSALIVDDGSAGGPRVYSYGVMERSASTAIAVITGRVTTLPAVAPAAQELNRLRLAQRSIRVQPLRLDPAAARRLASVVDLDARLPVSQSYDALTDNCSTRIRDLLNDATAGRLRIELDDDVSFTVRDAARDAARARPAFAIVADFFTGRKADARATAWDLASLPAQLADGIAHSSLALDDAEPAIRAEPRRASVTPLVTGIAGALLLIAIAAIVRTRTRTALRWHGIVGMATGVLLGVPGLVLAWAALIGEHTTMAGNINLVLANPVTFAALPLGVACFAGNVVAGKWLARLWIVLALIAVMGTVAAMMMSFGQDNAWAAAFVIPLLGGAAASALVGMHGTNRYQEQRA